MGRMNGIWAVDGAKRTGQANAEPGVRQGWLGSAIAHKHLPQSASFFTGTGSPAELDLAIRFAGGGGTDEDAEEALSSFFIDSFGDSPKYDDNSFRSSGSISSCFGMSAEWSKVARCFSSDSWRTKRRQQFRTVQRSNSTPSWAWRMCAARSYLVE